MAARLRRHWVGLALTGAVITRIAALITPHYWNHWLWIDDLADDWLSVLFLMLTTFLLWLTFKGSIRKAEMTWWDRHAALEEAWERRHASLLARERELLTHMAEARAALGISEAQEVPRSERTHSNPSARTAGWPAGLSLDEVQKVLGECTFSPNDDSRPTLYVVKDAS